MSAAAESILTDAQTSNGQPRDLTYAQVDILRKALETDFWMFVRYISTWDKLYEPFHKDLCTLFQAWGSKPSLNRLMAQMPRETGKSSIVTTLGTLWRLMKDPNKTYAIFNAKAENAENFVKSIQGYVEGSAILQTLWPERIPPGLSFREIESGKGGVPRQWPWNSQRIRIPRDVLGIKEESVHALGVGGSAAGYHFDGLLFDDLVAEKHALSPVEMQGVKNWVKTAFFLGKGGAENTQAFCVCTRWTYHDVYKYLIDEHDFKLLRRKALVNERSIIPHIYSTDYLLRTRTRDPMTFNAHLQNEPMVSEQASFDTSGTRFCRASPEERIVIDTDSFDPNITVTEDEPDQVQRTVSLEHASKILLVDPIPNKPTDLRAEPGSRFAMALWARDCYGRRFLLDGWVGRSKTPTEELRRMVNLCLTWGCTRIGIEEVVFSTLYKPFLDYLILHEYPSFLYDYVPLTTKGRQKDDRIAGLAKDYSTGFVYLNQGRAVTLDTGTQSVASLFLAEASNYTPGSTAPKDFLDASSYLMDPGVLGRDESPAERENRLDGEDDIDLRSGRDPVTNY